MACGEAPKAWRESSSRLESGKRCQRWRQAQTGKVLWQTCFKGYREPSVRRQYKVNANQAIAGRRLTLQVYDPNLGTNPKERDIVFQMIRTSTTNLQGVHFSMLEIRRSSYSMLHRSWYTDQEDLPRCVTPHTGFFIDQRGSAQLPVLS